MINIMPLKKYVAKGKYFTFYYIYCIALLTFHQFQGNKKYEAAGRVLFIALKLVKNQKCYIICS